MSEGRSATIAGGVGRYFVGVIGWAFCFWLSWAGAIALGGVIASVSESLGLKVAELAAGPAAFLLVGLSAGWLGAVLASRAGLTRPTYWAPSVTAAAVPVVLTTLSALDGGCPLESFIGGVLAVAPVLGGQLFATRWWRRHRPAPAPSI